MSGSGAKDGPCNGFAKAPGAGLRLKRIPMLSEVSRTLVLLDRKIIGEKNHRLVSFDETGVAFCILPESRSGSGFPLLTRCPQRGIESWQLRGLS